MTIRLEYRKITRFLISVEFSFGWKGFDLAFDFTGGAMGSGINNGNNVTRSMMVVTTRNIIWKTHDVCPRYLGCRQ